MNTVKKTVDSGLCISCGICKAVCPKNCIEYKKEKGLNLPIIDSESCVNCGRCMQVCPGIGFDYTHFLSQSEDTSFWFGTYQALYCAWSLDKRRRRNSVSGGVVTELTYNLLESGEYDSAFLIGTHQYDEKDVQTRRYTKGDSLEDTQKSRYLPVSQEQAVSYILSHRTEKIVLVGTSCFVQGIMKVIDTYKLERNNYFIIGLFCDKTMTWNIIEYFRKHPSLIGESMIEFYFRTKDVGGWPGGVQLLTDTGAAIDLPNTERMKVKEYFQPERCLYCLDKLNMFADIAVGDNYTGKHADKERSNSVIVRTQEGMRVWEKFSSAFYYEEADKEHIMKSQHLQQRVKNDCYSRLKEKKIKQKINTTGELIKESPITWKNRLQYGFRCLKIWVGKNWNKRPYVLSVCLIWKNIKLQVKKMLKRSSKCL